MEEMNGETGFNYTAADALNEALLHAGVTHFFVNTGTDYPPVIESWAKAEAEGRPLPEIVICPHEYAAMSAAQGYAQVSRKTPAVFVHVDVGTQNLGGAIHNAYRCRVPAFVLAGLSPCTMEGEKAGSRSGYIQYIQNSTDQAGIVRGYTKHAEEIRTGVNVQQLVYRALQLAETEPAGPVYITATREALEEEGRDIGADLRLWGKAAPCAVDPESLSVIAKALKEAKAPLIITSYLGRNPEAVPELVKLAERLAIPVLESRGHYMNFPNTHELHRGDEEIRLVKEADTILVLDSDLPWSPIAVSPKSGCRIFYVDIDPLKDTIPLWHIPAERSVRADTCVALRQLNACLDADGTGIDASLIAERRKKCAEEYRRIKERYAVEEEPGDVLNPSFVTACVREIIDDDTIVMNEVISDRGAVDRHLPRTKPGTFFASGGSSLGWFGGASVGAKLAAPDKFVVALASDGTFIFSCPTAVYWMARRYNAPFLTVIFNNQGWKAPVRATLGQHPGGYAAKSGHFWTGFAPAAQLDEVAAAAGGAFAVTVEKPGELREALRRAKEEVLKGRAAVVNVMLPPV